MTRPTMPAPIALQPLIGEHPSVVGLRDLVSRVARSKAGIVLIYGETGTGKGLVARTLHAQSERAQHNFTEINCAAIPGNLLESELFGHERGAFTGAVEKKIGLLEVSNGGSLFLDEIRELDPIMQAKILTLLDSRRFRRIGAVNELSTNARFIAATNKILLNEVVAGKFRDDLYYRLQVVSINIPPLRDRGDDVLVLAHRLLAKYNALHDSHFTEIDPAVKEIFRQYRWPGNVRELGNLLERICILEEGECVYERHLPPRIVREVIKQDSDGDSLQDDAIHAVPTALTAGEPMPAGDYFEQTMQFQKTLIENALQRSHGNLSRAAGYLGISRHALRHQLARLGMSVSKD